MSAVSHLDRFLQPVAAAFTPELAQTIVELRADAELESRVSTLREKAAEGTLTEDEAQEYRDFVEAVDVISILQGKARRYLANNGTKVDAKARSFVRARAAEGGAVIGLTPRGRATVRLLQMNAPRRVEIRALWAGGNGE